MELSGNSDRLTRASVAEQNTSIHHKSDSKRDYCYLVPQRLGAVIIIFILFKFLLVVITRPAEFAEETASHPIMETII